MVVARCALPNQNLDQCKFCSIVLASLSMEAARHAVATGTFEHDTVSLPGVGAGVQQRWLGAVRQQQERFLLATALLRCP